MWSVVAFDDDKTIEAVPSFWITKNVCAWPKKNAKKCIVKGIKPSKTDFMFVSARKLGKDSDDYYEARSKVLKGQDTSNLSSADNDDIEIVKKPKTIKHKIASNKKLDPSLWSPASCSGLSSSDHHDDSDDDPNFVIGKSLDNPPQVNAIKAGNIEKTIHSDFLMANTPKRKFDADKSFTKCLYSTTSAEKSRDENKTSQAHINDLHITANSLKRKLDFGKSITKSSRLTLTMDTSRDEDIVTKINRTSLNTWFEIKTLNERFDKLELLMMSKNYSSHDNVSTDHKAFTLPLTLPFNLPLSKEEDLVNFEEKLLDSAFKSKVVSVYSELTVYDYKLTSQ